MLVRENKGILQNIEFDKNYFNKNNLFARRVLWFVSLLFLIYYIGFVLGQMKMRRLE
jgi:hypothetical protein